MLNDLKTLSLDYLLIFLIRSFNVVFFVPIVLMTLIEHNQSFRIYFLISIFISICFATDCQLIVSSTEIHVRVKWIKNKKFCEKCNYDENNSSKIIL